MKKDIRSENTKTHNLIVIGAGAAGMMAAIRAAGDGKKVLLLEKLQHIGSKLKATGGGRCNLSNTLENERFMESFGRNGRFMSTALRDFDHLRLMEFFRELGVDTHIPDGFRIFPVTHSSKTIIDALKREMERLGIEIACDTKAEEIAYEEGRVTGVKTNKGRHFADNIIISTGGKGYPMLGAEGDGYRLAKGVGHRTTELYPAMMPLKTKESWVAECRADTIPKAKLVVDLKKYRRLKAEGDLIFTKEGIRGPVVLDFSREIAPLLAKMDEVPLRVNLTRGMNEEEIREKFKKELQQHPYANTLELLESILPRSVSLALCSLAGIDPSRGLNGQAGPNRDRLYKILAWTPLTITGHEGFKMAMITRGGINLKEVDPKTMQSRKLKRLYFCGEVLDLDGPCGGYNLQWSFASGYLAGALMK